MCVYAQDTVAMAFVALEIQDGIDNMLQQPGPGNRPFFRHMADDKHRYAASFGEAHQLTGYFLDLADAAGRRADLVSVDGLDRIDHDRGRPEFLNGFENLFERSFGQNVQRRSLHAEPFPTHFNLLRRLFAGNVQDAFALRDQAREGLQQEGRLANARIAANQNHRAGNHAAAENPVEFPDPGATAMFADDFDLANRNGLRGPQLQHRTAAAARRSAQAFLFHAVPATAVGTPTQPTW